VLQSSGVQETQQFELKTRTTPAYLTLEDGTIFSGYLFGAQKEVCGEVVFSTSMVGYPETITDPSYRGQILCLTYPLVGNYGVPSYTTLVDGLPNFFESDQIQVRGLIVHEACDAPSHHQSTMTLNEWLAREEVPGIYGIDTRRLARRLRERGVMLGSIQIGSMKNGNRLEMYDPNTLDLVKEVSVRRPTVYYPERKRRIALIDCGVKYSIIRNALKRNVGVTRFPYDSSADEILHDDPAGIIVSNGPGNPKMYNRTIQAIRELIDFKVPILGICLGNQLLALAEGADTYKMKYGHRSQNQPVLDLEDGRCYITTQNHGFAVEKAALEDTALQVWHVNANDKSIEGIRHTKQLCWGIQWHPEACPGPTDTEFIFDLFLKQVT
jgi:carbamoyl-phosphate synthase small subunit